MQGPPLKSGFAFDSTRASHRAVFIGFGVDLIVGDVNCQLAERIDATASKN
jgi:hypothetical protein